MTLQKMDEGKDEIIKMEKMIVRFTTSKNNKNNLINLNNNMPSIDLGECEDLLKSEYNLSNIYLFNLLNDVFLHLFAFM